MTAFSPPTVDVEAAVRALLGAARVRLLAWQVEPVAWRVVSEVTGGLHRLRGTAELDGISHPWSLIVKVGVHPSGSEDASAANGHRETLAYTSGILAPKNGFATARLLTVTRPTPEETWLWLEDVTDEGDELLSVARHALAARHLGNFNGGHPVSLVEAPDWLFQDWLPGLLPLVDGDEASATAMRPETWRLPAVQAAFPTPLGQDLERLSACAPKVFQMIERMPQSLCHLDPGRFNLCVRQDANGQDETVFLDWQMLGVGPLGADLAMMNVLNLYRLYLSPDEVQAYHEKTLAAFVEGLREAGVDAHQEEVSLAYRTVAALRAGAIVRVIVDQLASDEHAQTAVLSWGKRRGWNPGETWRAWGRNMRFLMALI